MYQTRIQTAPKRPFNSLEYTCCLILYEDIFLSKSETQLAVTIYALCYMASSFVRTS